MKTQMTILAALAIGAGSLKAITTGINWEIDSLDAFRLELTGIGLPLMRM